MCPIEELNVDQKTANLTRTGNNPEKFVERVLKRGYNATFRIEKNIVYMKIANADLNGLEFVRKITYDTKKIDQSVS